MKPPARPKISRKAAEARRGARPAAPRPLDALQKEHPPIAELYRRAQARLRNRPGSPHSVAREQASAAIPARLLHELEVHQVELEIQNGELQKTRDELEKALAKYTDLYEFAPVGYFSMNESGVILETNLTGAALLGMERSRLVGRRLPLLVSSTSRPLFLDFLKKVFGDSAQPSCEALLTKGDGGTLWAAIRATPAVTRPGGQKWCRLTLADVTASRQAEEAQRRVEVLADTNRGLNREIARREAVEKALQKSERHQSRLLAQSRNMQGQLRLLSHQILHAQEEERRRISRELHDEIAQTLVGINVLLATLSRDAAANPGGVRRRIARTQRLVATSVDIVHRFARELRPTLLDDLGLIPALQAVIKEFTRRTGVHVRLEAFPAIEQLNIAKRTVLYRVAQEALNNVARHARASRVEVIIEKIPGHVCMRIRDNGKSFAVERVQPSRGINRLGLLGMRERLEMVGGRFSVESAPAHGTTLHAQIPFDRPRARGGDSRGESSRK